MIARRLLVFVVALLLGAQVVRNSAVHALVELQPASAARFWSDHPDIELSLALQQIGQAARERRPAPGTAFAMTDDAASKSPLAAEPYLIHGVEAQLAGPSAAARRDFAAAQRRDPGSLPAAYFLADYFFRLGKPIEGLRQTAVLARLSPAGIQSVAPYVAAYAQQPANWPKIRELFASQPEIADSVLVALAANPAGSPAVLALADDKHRGVDSPWLPVLLHSLVDSAQYAKARAIWATVSRVRLAPGTFLYDADFNSPRPPPPFNWSLTSSTVGLAERQPGKRLHAIFYGSEDGVLASQLTLLPPGGYTLRFKLSGGGLHPEALSWSVRCDKRDVPLASVTLDLAAARGWSFQAPANCQAQWIELSGRSGDIAQQSDVTVTDLMLTRSDGGA